jgi:phosphomannomutase
LGICAASVSDQPSRRPDRAGAALDGVSVGYDDWHFNVRPSNTEPLLRLNLESLVSREHIEEKRDEVLGLIRG